MAQESSTVPRADEDTGGSSNSDLPQTDQAEEGDSGEDELDQPGEELDGYDTYDVLQTDQAEDGDSGEDELDQPGEELEGYDTYDAIQADQIQEDETYLEEDQPEEESMPVPLEAGAENETKTLGGVSLIDDVFLSERIRFGFSLSAYLAYTERLSGGDVSETSSTITALMPRAFINASSRKSRFHLNFGAGHRHYWTYKRDSWDYYASASYTYRLSKRSSIGVADRLHSSYNDAWSFLSIYSPIYYDPSFSNEVIFNRQRITRNSLSGTFNYRLTTNARFKAFAGYNSYFYSENTLDNTSTFQAGASFDYDRALRWKWLTLSTSYNMSLVNDRFRDRRVHNLQLARLQFNLGRSWRVWMGGGVGFTNTGAIFTDVEDEFFARPIGEAGIGYTSLNMDFSVTYQRGFTAGIGISKILMSDIVSARFGYRLSRRVSASLESHYYRSSELGRDGTLETFSAGGGLQFLIMRNLVASVNSSYQNQISHHFSVPGLDIERISAYAGLHFVWPSRRNDLR